MEYSKKISKAKYELILENKLSSEDKNEFMALIENFVESLQNTLIINFEKLTFIDSAGLGFLFLAKQAAIDIKKRLILKNPNGPVKEIFDLMNFKSFFKVEP